MFLRNILHATATLAVLFGLNTAFVEEAHAKRKVCEYVAWQFTPTHDRLFHKTAKATKQSSACNRARRRCNLKLERLMRQGKVGRGRCERWR